MDNTELLKDIITYCYWDYRLGVEDLERILKSGDFREKKKLVDRIVRHHPDPALVLLKLFPQEELREILHSLSEGMGSQRANPRHARIQERILLLRNCLLGERNFIPRLAWKKR